MINGYVRSLHYCALPKLDRPEQADIAATRADGDEEIRRRKKDAYNYLGTGAGWSRFEIEGMGQFRASLI
jgi:hypothetical protein